ncbi:hypothetical protein H7R52_17395 [Weissella confusa]|uniref:Uncharacterized protein n=1 Tax=Weissella confusa TaxID=1583 RepID=A0A923NK41_WEICO|nr:hypothetical protein [Weissella confusa]
MMMFGKTKKVEQPANSKQMYYKQLAHHIKRAWDMQVAISQIAAQSNDALTYVKSENVTIKPLDENAKVMINLDGEYGGDAPVVFKDHKAHIAMVANVDEMPDDSLIDLPLYLHED